MVVVPEWYNLGSGWEAVSKDEVGDRGYFNYILVDMTIPKCYRGWGWGRVTKSQIILHKELEGGCGDWEEDSDNLPFNLLGIVRKEGHGMIWKQ